MPPPPDPTTATCSRGNLQRAARKSKCPRTPCEWIIRFTGCSLFVNVMYPLVMKAKRPRMCPQNQTSAGPPSLLVSRPQQGQLHPQHRLCLLPRQHPEALTPRSPRSSGPPEPVPGPRASVHPALPPGGARELLTASRHPRKNAPPPQRNQKTLTRKQPFCSKNAFSMPAKLSLMSLSR